MPRTTHPASRHRHGRDHIRFHTDRIVAARRRAVARYVDDQSGGGYFEVGLRRVRLEDYLAAGAEEVSDRYRGGRLSRWTWVRVRRLSDRRDRLDYGHDCGWSTEWCDVCAPPRSRGRAADRAELVRLLAAEGGWRAELAGGD